MMRKIITITLIMIILLSNFSFAGINYSNTGGNMLKNIAEALTDGAYIDGDYSADSNGVDAASIGIYQYNTTTKQTKTGNTAVEYTKNNYYLTVDDESDSKDYLSYTIKFGAGTKSATNVATFIYKNGIKYNGQTYDIKFNIAQINKTGDHEQEVEVRIGRRDKSTSNLYTESTYTDKAVSPYISVEHHSGNKVEVKTEYYAINSSGTAIPISGLMKIADIDLYQGFFIDNFKAGETVNGVKNVFIDKANSSINNIYYKIQGNGSYIYDNDGSNIPTEDKGDAYFLITNKNRVDVTYTWEHGAGSAISFVPDVIKRYKKITTSVTGGTITPTITNIKDNENKTVTYAPTNAITQYLQSVTVDGTAKATSSYPSSYAFQNITSNHDIKVVYANKYVVTFDSKGGTPTPAKQYVLPSAKATKPADPTRTGYNFGGWEKGTTAYDFAAPVTSNITLDAAWIPISYKINYVLNGGINNTLNPGTYTIEDDIQFKNPTKAGYSFLGWFSDAEFKTKKDGISHETGDKTVYAKWQARSDTKYKEEHYKQLANGNYELVDTENKTGTSEAIATATLKTYPGYKENETHQDRKITGTIAPDGSLVLKRYYDKEIYKINYVLNDGTNNAANPSTYTVEDTIIFQNPTKPGNDFIGWYEDEALTKKKDGITKETGDKTVYAKWELKRNTPYKVEHYIEKELGKYELKVTDSLTGAIEELVTATPKTFEGYKQNTSNSETIASGKIKEDGSLVLKLYYDKEIYKINYSLDGGINSEKNPQTYTVEDSIVFQAPTKPGYKFEGWYEDEAFTKKKDGIAKETGDKTVYAKWTLGTATYKVEHYKEGSNEKYELIVTDELEGETNSKVTATAKEYSGYKENTKHLKRIPEGVVAPDGSLVLKLYYDKLDYKVTFDPRNETKINDQNVKYEDKVLKPENPQLDEFEFLYWYYINENEQEVQYDFNEPVTKDIDLIAKWKADENIENTDDNKKDPTTSYRNNLPKTGRLQIIIALGILIIALSVFGIRYFMIKNMMK